MNVYSLFVFPFLSRETGKEKLSSGSCVLGQIHGFGSNTRTLVTEIKRQNTICFFCKNNKLFVFLQSRTDNVSVQASFQTEMLQILRDKRHHY